MERDTSSEEALDCIRNEAHFLKMIDSDKVTKFWFFKEFRSHIVLGMEICKGGSLRDIMKWWWAKGLEFSDDECATIVSSILKALKEIHLLDIIHRDIKPANFLLKDRKDLTSIRIADFGLAKKLSMNVKEIQTGSGGTLLYQAPEQINGNPFSKVTRITLACWYMGSWIHSVWAADRATPSDWGHVVWDPII